MTESAPTLSRQTFAVIFMVLMVSAAGNTAMQTVLPAISRELQIPDIIVGLVFSFSALLWTITAPYWAQRAATRGRRSLMQIGILGFIIAMLFGGVALLLGLHAIVSPTVAIILFTLFRCSYGLFGSAANPAAQAYVATRTTGAERTTALAKMSAAFAVGTVVGPALAPFLIFSGVTLSGPLFCFALIGVATFVALRILMPADAPSGAARITKQISTKISWLDRRIAPFLIVAVLVGHAQAMVLQIMGFFIIDTLKMNPLDAQAFIGSAIMAGAIATVLAQWGVIPNFKLSPRQLLRWGCAIIFIGALLTSFAMNYGTIVIGFAVMSLGFGLVRPGFTAGASLSVRRDEQDAVAGAITSVNGSCYIVAPSIGIALYQWHNFAPFYVSAAIVMLLLVYAYLNPVLRTVQNDPPEADDVVSTFE
jgi:MFS family permease